MRRRFAILAALLVAIVSGDIIGCHVLRQTMRTQFDLWATTMRGQGFTLTYGTPKSEGVVWGAQLAVRDLTLAGGRAMLPGGLDWHSERVVLSLPLLHPTLLTVSPQGDQTLRLANAPASSFLPTRSAPGSS